MADQTFAVNCGFFDAVSQDRTYSADDMNRPYRRVIANGVFATPKGTPSTDLQVSAATGMNIVCRAGEGLFADKWFQNPAAISITVPDNTAVNPRIDSVIVQVDTTLAGRVGNIVYRTGTPASSPVPPSINQTEGVVEYRLANIRVNSGVSAITQSVITDRRGSSDCPWVTSLIYQVDTSTLYDQWQAAYEEYFETEKAIWDAWYAQLTEDLDVSMTLDRHVNTVTTTAQTTGYIPIGLAYNHNTDILEVYINGLRAVEGTHYVVVDDTRILVENQLQIGQTVTFVVMRSVISGSAANITVLLQELESQIAGIAGGTPTVVDSTSEMTDTDKIYILSSDSKWYYYSATQEDFVIGGTYGGVPTDTTLTQEGMAADAKAVGDALADKADADDLDDLDDRVTVVEDGVDAVTAQVMQDEALVDVIVYTDTPYDQSSQALTFENGYPNTYGVLTSKDTASNKTAWIQVDHDCEVYVECSNYYYFCVYNTEPFKAANTVERMACTRSDIPTAENPYHVTAGQFVAVGLYLCYPTNFTLHTLVGHTEQQERPTVIGALKTRTSALEDAVFGKIPWKYGIDKVLCIGDSLTYGSPADSSTMPYPISQNYPYYLGRMLGLTNAGDITNAGVSNYGAKTYFHNKFDDYTLSDYNTFIIFLGTNSGLTDSLDTDVNPYQDYHDFTDNDTGCYCRMIEEILEARPNAIILLVNTWHIATVQPETRVAVRSIGTKYGLPVVETYDIMRYGVNPQYHGNVDNVHCSKAGYLALANLIVDKLDEYFSADISRVNKGMS